MMTDQQREATGYGKEEYIIASNYAQDHAHPDYVADDPFFQALWDTSFETFFRDTHTILCWAETGDYGEWTYLKFDYTDY